jgi:hypothetical protein
MYHHCVYAVGYVSSPLYVPTILPLSAIPSDFLKYPRARARSSVLKPSSVAAEFQSMMIPRLCDYGCVHLAGRCLYCSILLAKNLCCSCRIGAEIKPSCPAVEFGCVANLVDVGFQRLL